MTACTRPWRAYASPTRWSPSVCFGRAANTWVEDNPYVLAIGAELSLTAEQMHDKFVRAKLKDAQW